MDTSSSRKNVPQSIEFIFLRGIDVWLASGQVRYSLFSGSFVTAIEEAQHSLIVSLLLSLDLQAGGQEFFFLFFNGSVKVRRALARSSYWTRFYLREYGKRERVGVSVSSGNRRRPTPEATPRPGPWRLGKLRGFRPPCIGTRTKVDWIDELLVKLSTSNFDEPSNFHASLWPILDTPSLDNQALLGLQGINWCKFSFVDSR